MWFCCLSCSLFQLSQTYVAFIGYFFSSLTTAFNFLYSTHTSYHMPMYLLLIYGQFKCNDIIINHQKGQQLGQTLLVLGVLIISSLLLETYNQNTVIVLVIELFNLS